MKANITKPNRPPTARQLIVLSMLDQWIKINDGRSPSYRELALWCNCKSVRTMTEHVHYLIRKGLVGHIQGEWRSFFITDAGAKALKLEKIPTIQIRLG